MKFSPQWLILVEKSKGMLNIELCLFFPLPEESQLEINSMLCCKIVMCLSHSLKCKCLSRGNSRQECNNVSSDFCD